MGTVNPANLNAPLRGKVSGMIYSLQPNGTVTVRSVGVQIAPSTGPEKKGQDRMRLGHGYVRAVLRDPLARSAYAGEAQRRNMRTCDLVMSDFLKDPVIASVDVAKYNGRAGGWLLILTGDDFKVARVRVVFRNAAHQRLEEGFAVPAQGSTARVWIYTAQKDLAPGQILTIEATATDRAGHSTALTTSHSI